MGLKNAVPTLDPSVFRVEYRESRRPYFDQMQEVELDDAQTSPGCTAAKLPHVQGALGL